MKKTFNFEDLQKKLEFYADNTMNVLLTGLHGTGKTSIILNIFRKKYKKWLYFSASTMDVWTDFVGVPKERIVGDKSILTFIKPEYMTDDVEAIMIDEYGRSPKKLRNAIMELIQFRSINGHKFPNLKIIWAATNPYNEDEDEPNYDVEPIDPAQLDRWNIQIEVPYAIDHGYFEKKYGGVWAEGASEWWWNLPKEIGLGVSPRRLDYALEVAQFGGDIFDVLPKNSNPSKLLACLKHGGIEKKLVKIFEEKNTEDAVSFFNTENNYQAAIYFITRDVETSAFFVPLLDEERQVSLFFSNSKFKEIVFGNSLFYKELLETVEKNKLCDADTLRYVAQELKRLRGVDKVMSTGNSGPIDFGGFFKS
jgi:hypothetical protein